MDIISIGHALSVWFLPIIVAITLHEAAHAWMAERCGDDTARMLGRVTFNPVKHVDPIGTLLLPGMLLLLGSPFLFGFAKPVPVNFSRLNNPKRDMIWVALAGPGINVILALISVALIHLAIYLPEAIAAWVIINLTKSILVNIVLAIFNMFPLPPLDGGRVVSGLLPHPLDWRFASLERYGLFILLGLIFAVPWLAQQFGYSFNPVLDVLEPLIIKAFLFIAGFSGFDPLKLAELALS